jgi:hypothetical protein
MSDYQKNYTIPLPAGDFDKQMQDWLLSSTNAETLSKYLQIYNLHESLVKRADECGDRITRWHQNGNQGYWEIHWRSDDIHMTYMGQIPLEDRLFYEQCWDDFHKHLGTNYQCVPK